MANAAKKKGTQAESELRTKLNSYGFHFERTAPGTLWDLEQQGDLPGVTQPVNVLATRPDYGDWLFTTDLQGLVMGITPADNIRVEVKRYARFALHSIWKKKFGRKPPRVAGYTAEQIAGRDDV